MRKRIWIVMALTMVIPGLLLTVSCSKKNKQPVAVEKKDDAAEKAELARQKKLEEERLMQERLAAEKMQQEREMFENTYVFFAYDSAVLDDMAQNILKEKADWLANNPDNNVLIEGHCDERGTVEYNLALGDRRAESAKRFLISLGVDASRLTTVSFGEERPLESGNDEAAWAKNRRDQFVIK